MSTRITKTIKEYVIQSYYPGHGWEDVNAEDNRCDARRSLREYNANEAYPHRLIIRRIPNPEYAQVLVQVTL